MSGVMAHIITYRRMASPLLRPKTQDNDFRNLLVDHESVLLLPTCHFSNPPCHNYSSHELIKG